jgi:drug/metabolite transporter (DMT)-like permease
MIYLITAALSITTLSLIMRKATLSTDTLWGVILGNYLTAATLTAAITLTSPIITPSPFTIALGAVTGITYTIGMYLNLILMSKRGAAITSSMIQLAVIIPITASVIIYGENITTTQLIGIILAITSLPLLASKPNQKLEIDKTILPMILITILVVGFSQTSSKILIQNGLQSQNNYFFLAIFTSATLLVAPIAYRNRKQIKKTDTIYGIGVGTFNLISNRTLLLALTTLPGAIVFPVSSAGSLLMVTIAAIILFKEKVSRANVTGIIMTLIAVVLINI